MPTYGYQCNACSAVFDRVLPLSKRKELQACPECQAEARQTLTAGVGAVLRGDGWTGKNILIKSQMAARRARVGRREVSFRHDGPQIRLAPNVGGEQVDSWSEATKLARSKGKETSLYAQRARQEGKTR